MQILRTFISFTMAALAAGQFFTAPTRSDPVLVRYVLDGDTIDVASVGRVRLLGIDAPEIRHGLDTAAPFAYEAKDRLASLVLHRWVRLEYEGQRDDVYGRRLAYVLNEDGTCVNGVLIRDGLARISARVPMSRLDELRRAEAEAQSFRRGMWGAMSSASSSTDPVPVPVTAKSKTRTKTTAAKKSAGGPGRQPRTRKKTDTVSKVRVRKVKLTANSSQLPAASYQLPAESRAES